jgi:hypothetical protein
MSVLPKLLLPIALFAAPCSVIAGVVEPKILKSAPASSNDYGVVRLSVRTQRQYIDTFFLYFVEIRPDGSDGDLVLRFERGAGVPLMGTNQIDVKTKYYAVPSGRYRLLAYTFTCDSVPPHGTVCGNYGVSLPTERYKSDSPSFTVSGNRLTDAGDFILEYVKALDLSTADLFKDWLSDDAYGIRWRPLGEPLSANYRMLPTEAGPSIPAEFHSRIECNRRPKNKRVQFPFRCN